VNDERIESELRAWLAAHTEPDVPESLRRFLADLPTARPGLDRVQPPGPTAILHRHRHGALPALVACAIIVAVAVALGFGLNRRPGPSVGISPSPSLPQPSPNGSGPSRTQTAAAVVDAAPVDADDGWALTHDDLVWTDDAGASWTSIRPADVDASTIRAVHFLSPISGWLVWWAETTGAVTVERTNDGGHTWAASHLPERNLDHGGSVSIQAVDGGTVWIQVEATHSSASSIGSLYLSQDGGISWVPGITIPGGWPIRFVSASNGWTTARPLRDELDVTTDGARMWHPVTIDRPPGHAQDAMSFDLPTFTGDVAISRTGVLPVTLYTPLDPSGGDQTATLALYTSHDGGATWRFETTIGATTALSPPLTITSAILDQQAWLVASDPQRARLSRTTDGGQTWNDVGSTGLTGWVGQLRFVDGTNGWALTQPEGADFKLSATNDGGRSWRPLDPVAQAPVAPSTTASPAAGPFRWILVNSDGELATYSVGQVIRRTDGAYLAIAFGQETRILSSTDGRTWAVQPADPALVEASADHLSVVNGIAEGAGGFTAVGAIALDDFSSGDARAWTSSDGLRWQVAETSTGMADADMLAVTAGPDGYVAVGSEGFPGANTQLPGARGAAAWTSADGTRWTRVAGQASFAGAIMTGVRRIDQGYVAWGETFGGRDVQGTTIPPIWTSSDGIRWQRASGVTDSGGPGAPIGAIISVGNRLAAVGTRRLSDAAGGTSVPGAWTSTDGGRTWSPAAVADDSTGAPRSGGILDVAADGSALLAVGRLEPPEGQLGPASAAVWQSSDQGNTWTSLPGDPSFARAGMRHIVSRGSSFGVFGQADDSNAYADAELIWVAEPR
jgi:hypothetical protein